MICLLYISYACCRILVTAFLQSRNIVMLHWLFQVLGCLFVFRVVVLCAISFGIMAITVTCMLLSIIYIYCFHIIVSITWLQVGGWLSQRTPEVRLWSFTSWQEVGLSSASLPLDDRMLDDPQPHSDSFSNFEYIKMKYFLRYPFFEIPIRIVNMICQKMSELTLRTTGAPSGRGPPLARGKYAHEITPRPS